MPVVVHDRDLRRVTGRPVRVGQVRAADLAAMPLTGSSETVPTLVAALAVLGHAPVMVEVKQAGLRAGALERAVAAILTGHAGPACVAGFNPATTRWFRRSAPQVLRVLTAGVLDGGPLPGPVRRRLAALADLDAVAPHAISYELAGLPTAETARWRDAGGTVVTWTVTSEDELRRAGTVADNVIFERVRPGR